MNSISYAQKKANTPKTSNQEMNEVAVAYTESEVVKRIGTALTRAAMDKSNREAVSKTTQEIWKYSKDMSKDQMEKFLARLSKMSTAGINQLKKMSPRELNSFVAGAAGKLSKNAGVLKQIIAGAGDKAGNMALQTISQVDDIIANNGKVPKALYVKLKDAASKLPPEKAKAYLDLLKKKFSSDWADVVNLEDASKGPASLVGTVVDGVFVLNDAYDIYYSDDEPEVKGIKATGKMIDYGTSTYAGVAAAELGAGELAFAAGFGVGLTIALTANRVSTLYTEVRMLQKEREAVKDAEKNEKIDNEILVRRQLININGKIKAGKIDNAQFLLVKLQKFMLDNRIDNEKKLLALRDELEDKANHAERNQLINEIINKAKFPYNKALNFYQRGVELKDAKTFAAEAFSILKSNVKKYPEIAGLTAISKTEQLINAINEKIASAADFVITEVAAPEKVYVGQSIVIPAYVKGGIPYYNAYGATHSFFTDNTKINMNWDAPSEPGIEKFTIKLKDCMGSIASASVSIEVVENMEEESINEEQEPSGAMEAGDLEDGPWEISDYEAKELYNALETEEFHDEMVDGVIKAIGGETENNDNEKSAARDAALEQKRTAAINKLNSEYDNSLSRGFVNAPSAKYETSDEKWFLYKYKPRQENGLYTFTIRDFDNKGDITKFILDLKSNDYFEAKVFFISKGFVDIDYVKGKLKK